MSRVVHFEIQAEDVERAKTFYAAVFGWTFQDYGQFTGSPYWGIVTEPDDEPGINGGLLQRPALTGMAWHGYYLDPEGNTFGIHQPDLRTYGDRPAAKITEVAPKSYGTGCSAT